MAMRRVLVVVNPAAGGEVLRIASAVGDRCAAHADTVTVVSTECPGHAEQIAAERAGAADIIVAVGGDGTARDIAAGLYRARQAGRETVAALLIAPGGTGNSSYRGLWSDRPWQTVLDAVLGGGSAVRWLDLALIRESGRVVLLGAGSGLLAEALLTARELDGTPGRPRYQRALVETFGRFRPHTGRVSVDGTALSAEPALMVAVGGGRYRGGEYLLLPDSELDDGLLDVCVVQAGAPLGEMAVLAAAGRHVGHPAVRYARGREVVVERTDGADLVFESDGDLDGAGGTRRTLTVLPHAIPVVIPTSAWSGEALTDRQSVE